MKTVTLSEICTDISYGYTASAENNTNNIKFLRITDIQGGSVDWKTVPSCQISESDAEKYLLQDGDIVIARTGNSTGENYIFHGHHKTVYASYLIRFRPNKILVDPDYVWFTIRSKMWWDFVNSVKTGSAQAGANAQVLGKYPISLPSLPIQNEIAKRLKTIDNKIDLNNQMNETLESIAKAIFKEWFIDFGPVRAKAEGRRPFGMDDETAALFPDSFEDSELGPIPKGWKVAKMKEIVNINRGSSPRPIQKFIGNDIPWFKIADATAASSPFIFHTREKIKKEGEKFSVVVEPGDLIVSNSATCGIPKFVQLKGCVHDGWLVFKKFKVEKIFLYQNFLFIINHLNQIADGSVQKNLNTNIVGEQSIIIPPQEIIKNFSFKSNKIFDLILNLEKEKIHLEKLRDLLLPKLISGEISLSNNDISTISNETTTHIPFQQKDSA
jgi:type I restriction enzyme S subunit